MADDVAEASAVQPDHIQIQSYSELWISWQKIIFLYYFCHYIASYMIPYGRVVNSSYKSHNLMRSMSTNNTTYRI